VKKESRAITNIQDQFLEDFEEVGRKRINKTKKYFQGLKESQIKTKLNEFIARQEVSTKNSLDKINASGRTILHAILGDAQQKRFEEQLQFLFKWCMTKYPELYRSKYTGDNNEAKTVLHLALRPAAKTESRYFVRFFVNNYPGEAAEILRAEKEDSLLLHHIMPFISDYDNVKFLTLFNSTDIDTDVEEDKHTQNTNTSTPNNLKFEASNRVDTGSRGPTSAPAKADSEGNTVLHLAAQYVPEYNTEETESQLRMVKKVFLWCPKALRERNNDDHSVYQHRLHGLCTYVDDKNPNSPGNGGGDTPQSDNIANFLKDEIMHLLDRDQIIRLLRGGYGAVPGPGE